MSERIKDGGPAFPVGLGSQPDQYMSGTGLSLRDYFAAKALTAVIAATCAGTHHPSIRDDEKGVEPAMARNAYAVADAMLAAREAKP